MGYILTLDAIINEGFNPEDTIFLLENREITGIDPQAFDNCINLEQIFLGNNSITALPVNIFNKVSKLRKIHLSNNLLTTIRKELFQLNILLEVVNLASNQIEDVAFSPNLSMVKIVDLQNNRIKALPSQIFAGFKSLAALDLSNNLLTTLPELFIAPGSATELRELRLENNQLQTLPAQAFANLQKLEFLNITDNQITELSPQFFAALPNLKTLIAGRNLIKRLPKPINLPNLERAYFEGNPLEEKPQIVSTKPFQLYV